MDVVNVMTRDVVSVGPGASVRDAARLMVDRRISGLPVVDGSGRVIGIISEADYVARDGASTWVTRVLFKGDGSALLGSEEVADLMSTDPITIPATATVTEAARVMTRHGVKRLPVVDGDRMVGIVTRSDLLRSYMRADDDIEGEARFLVEVLPAPMCDVEVTVHDGVVELAGYVQSAEQARLITLVVRSVEGVAGVDNRLDWENPSQLGENPLPADATVGLR